jgi:hypothetical protein
MRRYVFSNHVIIVLIQIVTVRHPLFDAVRKTLAELIAKSAGKLPDQKVSVIGSLPTLLFLFDDSLANLPVGFHHHEIDAGICSLARIPQNCPDAVKKNIVPIFGVIHLKYTLTLPEIRSIVQAFLPASAPVRGC